CARPASRHPLLVSGQRCLYLGFFQDLSRGAPFHRPEPSQVGERNDGGGLPAKVDHLIRLMRVLVAGRLRGHSTTVPVSVAARRYPRLCRTGEPSGSRALCEPHLLREPSPTIATCRDLVGPPAPNPEHRCPNLRDHGNHRPANALAWSNARTARDGPR